MSEGSRAARSWQPRGAPRWSRSVTSLSSPPMIAASATARSPSVISRSSGVEVAKRPVERAQLLARACVPHDDPAAGQLRAVEGVQRAPPHVHDVVRHVDDVRDRAHVGEEEPRPQPLRRRADRDVAERPGRCSEDSAAKSSIAMSTSSASTICRILWCRRVQLASEQRRDLARETDHREQVDAIHRRRHVEHLVADRQHVDERRPGLGAVGQHHDPGVVVSEPDLVLGEDHPARRLAAQLALVERLVEDRQERPGERDGNGRASLEVPRAADDLAGVSLPHVDLADAQPIGVRMRRRPRARGRRGSGRGCRPRPAPRRR